jgi:RES domain
MAAKRKVKTTIRCALASDKGATLGRFGASARFVKRRASLAAKTLLQAAVENFQRVWRGQSGVSRYSDGSYPVLYTATKAEVAKAERCYWLIETVFKKTSVSEVDNFFLYSCAVAGKCFDYTRNWKKNKNLVHPTDYKYCHELARRSLDAGAEFLIVPSARKLGGCCVPIFKKGTAKVHAGMPTFKVFWNARTRKCYTLLGGKPRYIGIDPVYRMV